MHAPQASGIIAASRLSALAAALAILGLTLPVGATGANEPDSMRLSQPVRVSDIDLSRVDDLGRLYSRIRRAAEKVCEPLHGRALTQHAAWRSCKEAAIRNAVTDIDRPAFTSYYLARVGVASAKRG